MQSHYWPDRFVEAPKFALPVPGTPASATAAAASSVCTTSALVYAEYMISRTNLLLMYYTAELSPQSCNGSGFFSYPIHFLQLPIEDVRVGHELLETLSTTLAVGRGGSRVYSASVVWRYRMSTTYR
jgi:hypothetical protein